AVRGAPGYGEAYVGRGLVRKTLGDVAGGNADLEKAAQIDPIYQQVAEATEAGSGFWNIYKVLTWIVCGLGGVVLAVGAFFFIKDIKRLRGA
ncbi:MAG: hypothetical protein M3347_17285, partial [Armatimonadota bacterium]|nr:hypothetical protein [Armatimonadota bacterium]